MLKYLEKAIGGKTTIPVHAIVVSIALRILFLFSPAMLNLLEILHQDLFGKILLKV